MQGWWINIKWLENRRKLGKVENTTSDTNEAKTYLAKAQKEWEDFKIHSKD